jgi:tetratricopeptide (TPR) repeat protein
MAVRGIAALVLASAGLFAICQPANAAVLVYGRGPSLACYQAAEYGSDAQEGIQVCSEAIDDPDISPRDMAATMINRSILRTHSGDFEGAVTDCTRGLRMNSELAEGYVDRGVAEIMMKNWQDALTDINRGIDMGTDKLDFALYDRGIVEEATGNIRAAYDDYHKALQMSPDFEPAQHALTHFKVVRKPADSSANGT